MSKISQIVLQKKPGRVELKWWKIEIPDPVTSYIHLYQDLLFSFWDSAHLVHGIPHYGHLQPLQAQVSIVCAHCPKIIWISRIKTKPVTSGTSATEYSTVHLYSMCPFSKFAKKYFFTQRYWTLQYCKIYFKIIYFSDWPVLKINLKLIKPFLSACQQQNIFSISFFLL